MKLMHDIQMQCMNMIKNQRKRSSIQNDTHAIAKLEEAGLNTRSRKLMRSKSNSWNKSGKSSIENEGQPRIQLHTVRNIPIEGPKWIPIK